ncbi:MAG: hypothetical protein M4D80_34280 [Myxococcota bacterium]|nr:hypothetical protein [Myxococcota bacterium]
MSTIVFAVLAVAGTFGFMIYMKKRLDTQYAHLRAGRIAQRLGMQVVEGDPEHNLATRSVLPSVQNTGSAKGFLKQVAATQIGGKLGEFRLRLEGRPYGAETELVLFCREELQVGFSENVTTTWSDLRLTVRSRCNVTPFELRLKKAMTGLEPRENEAPMPVQRFADPALDEKLVLEAYDPQLSRALAVAIAPLTQLAYVHVIGAGNTLSFTMTPTSVMSAAPSIEQILHVLVSIAAVFEGQPAPRALPAVA